MKKRTERKARNLEEALEKLEAPKNQHLGVVCFKKSKIPGQPKTRRCHTLASAINFYTGSEFQKKTPDPYQVEKVRRLRLTLWERPCDTYGCPNDRKPGGHQHCQSCLDKIRSRKQKLKKLMAKAKKGGAKEVNEAVATI